MCRKLGKGHVEYINRNDNLYEVGEDGVKRIRRTYAGRRVDKHHGTNIVHAMTDYRDKIWSWFPDQAKLGQKVTKAKTEKLEQLQKLCNHGMNRRGRKRHEHLRRNNVSIIKRNKES